MQKHYCVTFDVTLSEKIRYSFQIAGFKEGEHYRIGMTENRHEMGIRCLLQGSEKQFRYLVENAKNPRTHFARF